MKLTVSTVLSVFCFVIHNYQSVSSQIGPPRIHNVDINETETKTFLTIGEALENCIEIRLNSSIKKDVISRKSEVFKCRGYDNYFLFISVAVSKCIEKNEQSVYSCRTELLPDNKMNNENLMQAGLPKFHLVAIKENIAEEFHTLAEAIENCIHIQFNTSMSDHKELEYGCSGHSYSSYFLPRTIFACIQKNEQSVYSCRTEIPSDYNDYLFQEGIHSE